MKLVREILDTPPLFLALLVMMFLLMIITMFAAIETYKEYGFNYDYSKNEIATESETSSKLSVENILIIIGAFVVLRMVIRIIKR